MFSKGIMILKIEKNWLKDTVIVEIRIQNYFPCLLFVVYHFLKSEITYKTLPFGLKIEAFIITLFWKKNTMALWDVDYIFRSPIVRFPYYSPIIYHFMIYNSSQLHRSLESNHCIARKEIKDHLVQAYYRLEYWDLKK